MLLLRWPIVAFVALLGLWISEAGALEITAKSNSGDFIINVNCNCGPKTNEWVQLEVAVTPDVASKVSTGLQFLADMPSHHHGMVTQPKVTSLGGNRYHIEGIRLHMSGEWILYFDVSFSDVTERAQLPIIIE
jgi:hypothetical protein